MANLFRPHYTKIDAATGGKISMRAKCWYGQFVDAQGERKRVKLVKNKTAAQQMLNELVRKEELKRAGIFNPYEHEQKRPIAEHLAEWESSLCASGSSCKHVRHTLGCVRRLFLACGFARLSDISATAVESYLADQRQRGHDLLQLEPGKCTFTKTELAAMLGMKKPALSKLIGEHRIEGEGHGKARRYSLAAAQQLRALRTNGRSVRTSNFTLGATKQFCRWLVQNRRVAESPLAHLSLGNVRQDKRHNRRKLSLDELRKLIEAARASTKSFRGLLGIDRAMLYLVGSVSGFRVNELESLSPESFDLADELATGRFQPIAFLATVKFIQGLEERKLIQKFTSVRREFEEFLVSHKHFVSAQGHAFGGRTRSLELLVAMYRTIYEELSASKSHKEVEARLLRDSPKLALHPAAERQPTRRTKFSTDDKSASFLQQALESPNRCNICGARLHMKGINIDHKKRKQQGGLAAVKNAQPTHPYCNSGYKEAANAKEASRSQK